MTRDSKLKENKLREGLSWPGDVRSLPLWQQWSVSEDMYLSVCGQLLAKAFTSCFHQLLIGSPEIPIV